jgi:hypothetical protein
VEHQRLTFWYDGAGNLERILNHERWTSAMWSNPLSGATVPYTQSSVITTVLAVPGDFSSATETTVGEVIFTDPQTGKKVLRSVGRAVVAPSQSLLTYTAEPGSPSQDALNLLASWAATTDNLELPRPVKDADRSSTPPKAG